MAKRKTLPKDFEDILASGDQDAMRAVFDACEVNAYGGHAKQVALAFPQCPPELARWLVDQGLDVDTVDHDGSSPLASAAYAGRVDQMSLLLELGAAVEGVEDLQPLFQACKGHRPEAVQFLLEHGANIHFRDQMHRRTPLEEAVVSSNNIELPATARIAALLLEAGAERSEVAADGVRRVGKDIESRRPDLKESFLAKLDPALDELYRLFDVSPVAQVTRHDGTSRIEVQAQDWRQQYNELWDALVPSSGPAATVQGEVIRITGRVGHELLGNGGINWDDDFRAMLEAWSDFTASGVALSRGSRKVAKRLRRGKVDEAAINDLTEAAVQWVLANPDPLPLPQPEPRPTARYTR